jgi:cell division inhibitor SulA
MNHSIEHIISRPDTWRGFKGPIQSRFVLRGRSANSEWHGTDHLPTGFAALDPHLQAGGWPKRGAIEVLSDSCGMGAMGLFLPTMATLSEQSRWQTFVAPPYTPYSPLLSARGIDTQQVLMVHPKDREELLWATEQALRSTTCSIVFSWLGATDFRYAELRKLQLAAAENDTLAVLFRSTDAQQQHSPASLRLLMSGYRQVRILKQRGGSEGIDIRLPCEEDVPGQPQWWELPDDAPLRSNPLPAVPAV